MVRAGSWQTLQPPSDQSRGGCGGDAGGCGLLEWDYYAQIAVAVRRAARECGIIVEWGGEWKTLKDGPHFQLTFQDYPA